MSPKERLLSLLRLGMLSKREKKEIYRVMAEDLSWHEGQGMPSVDDILLATNKILIEKYGELAVYDYLREKEKRR